MSHNLKELQVEFLENLEMAHGRSSKTVENYDRYLRRFFEVAKIQAVSDISLQTIREFRRYLGTQAQGGEGVAAATQNYHFIAIRQFLKYLAKRDVPALAAEKIDLAKLPERDIDVLYPEELDALLSAPKTDSLSGFRDRALLHTLFSTGLRISEAVSLNRDDIRESSNEIPVRGKGNKVRVVFLSPEAQEAIGDYESKRSDVDPALFIRHKRSAAPADDLRLSVRTIQRLMKKYAAMAGITKDITPHTLRHSYATDLLTNGADVREVQQLLGHASITTTQVYTHLTDTHLRDVHSKYHHRRTAEE
jgi:site-specific recombinase XerD